MNYIYALVCPIENVIRYIGKATNPKTRFVNHITTARTGRLKHHNARWIAKLLRQGLLPSLEILAEVKDGERWQDVERRLIAEAKARGVRLTNTLAGGEGPDFIDPVLRAEVSAKISLAHRKAWDDPEKRKLLIERLHSPTASGRRAVAMTKRNADPIYRAKQSATLRRIRNTEEARAAQSARSVRLHADPETKARHSAALVSAFKRPEAKANLAAAMAEVRTRPEWKAKRSVQSKALWADPEFRAKIHNDDTRAKMSEKLKARWQDNTKEMLRAMNNPERVAKISAAMSKRNADPAFRAKVSDPEVRARAAATLRATWARRKRQADQKSTEAA